MDMTIGGPTDPRVTGAQPLATPPVEPASARRTERPADPSSAADASVSERARLLQRAREAYAASPDVRAETVYLLRQAVAEGRYQVDTRALAASLLHLVK